MDFCKSWNTTHQPSTLGTCQGLSLDPAIAPSFPIVCVDWCDAFAYCEWAGKRLCGKIGGGPNAFGAPADASMSQWYRACSAGGSKAYPYGNQFDEMACVGDHYDGQPGYQMGSDVAQEVGSAQGCEGGSPGVYDLSGNVREWEDSCETAEGNSDKCYRRGGGFKDNASAQMCAGQATSNRSAAVNDLGFRCCAEIVK
jgi:formylglycine-generating enzyme required for sulfatase activity